jgi:hypothetical protein
MSVTRWPHVRIEAGPAIAGLEPGDAIAVVPDEWIFLRSFYWSDDRFALAVECTSFGHTTGDAWRVRSDPPRLEHVDYKGNFGSGARWEPAPTDIVVKEPWTLRIVLDGPPLATMKTFGPHRAVYPRLVNSTYGQGAFSEWLLPEDGARNALIVTESLKGEVTWRVEPRRIGVPVGMLREAAVDDIDPEIAAGIVAQMEDTQPMTYVGFDGVVRAIESTRSSYREAFLAHLFAYLTTGVRDLSGDAARATASRLASTRPATQQEIANVVRALCADAWAREQAIVEECGVLAG